MAGLKQKDREAFEETIRQYTPLAAGIVRNVSRGSLSREDREEIVADVFVTLWKNAEHIMDGKLKGYLCCIAKTKTLTRLSAVTRHNDVPLEDFEAEDDFSITAEVEKQEVIDDLREIIAAIDRPEQEIVIRYYYYCQNVPKIAEILHMNPETVKTKLRRTREKIKAKLKERGYDL